MEKQPIISVVLDLIRAQLGLFLLGIIMQIVQRFIESYLQPVVMELQQELVEQDLLIELIV